MNKSETNIRSYSSTEVAKICDVHFTTVYHWISKGLLEARKTPGGHNRINEADLFAFLHKYKYPIPKIISDRTTTRILIVEDETAQRRLLVRLIKNHFENCETFEATNGFEAGFMVRELRPTLVILDLLLPGIHGARICRIIRQSKELQNTGFLSV
jgi:excisionase family DNA binding protein